MIAPVLQESPGLGPAFAAARTRVGLVALLFASAALGWWWTFDQMQGMDGGPWTDLGTLSFFAPHEDSIAVRARLVHGRLSTS